MARGYWEAKDTHDDLAPYRVEFSYGIDDINGDTWQKAHCDNEVLVE